VDAKEAARDDTVEIDGNVELNSFLEEFNGILRTIKEGSYEVPFDADSCHFNANSRHFNAV